MSADTDILSIISGARTPLTPGVDRIISENSLPDGSTKFDLENPGRTEIYRINKITRKWRHTLGHLLLARVNSKQVPTVEYGYEEDDIPPSFVESSWAEGEGSTKTLSATVPIDLPINNSLIKILKPEDTAQLNTTECTPTFGRVMLRVTAVNASTGVASVVIHNPKDEQVGMTVGAGVKHRLLLAGSSYQDNGMGPDLSYSTIGRFRKNYTELQATAIQYSRRQMLTKFTNVEESLKNLRDRKIYEFLRGIMYKLMFQESEWDGRSSNYTDLNARSMTRGLLGDLVTNRYVIPSMMTEGQFWACLEPIFTQFDDGSNTRTVFCSYSFVLTMQAILRERFRYVNVINKAAGLTYKRMETPFGYLDLVPSPLFKSIHIAIDPVSADPSYQGNWAMIVNKKDIGYKHMPESDIQLVSNVGNQRQFGKDDLLIADVGSALTREYSAGLIIFQAPSMLNYSNINSVGTNKLTNKDLYDVA